MRAPKDDAPAPQPTPRPWSVERVFDNLRKGPLMKTFGLFAGACGMAFLLAGFQLGIFRAPEGDDSAETEKKEALAKKPKLRFPLDLVPAARAEAVPGAAAYDPSAQFNKMAILYTTGKLHHEWQERLREEWQAENVEETALVVVVGPQKRTHIEHIPYPGGAPPIDRYKFELEVSVVEAKTGKVLDNRMFVNIARQIQRVETWNTTALGSPVDFRTVFNWAASGSRTGFPPSDNSKPIVNYVN